MNTRPVFILIHSPLAAPITWSSVTNELHLHGSEAVVITLPHVTAPPFWTHHIEPAVKAINHLSVGCQPVLVGHSGAGVLLPAVAQGSSRPIAGYIFVDADIPRSGASRLDLFADPQEAQRFRDAAQDGTIPLWTADDLSDIVLPPLMRDLLVEALQPLPLAVYEESIPVFEGWPDAPCGYLRFSDACAPSVEYARKHNWAYAEVPGTHFQMLNDAPGVTKALLKLSEMMGIAQAAKQAGPSL